MMVVSCRSRGATRGIAIFYPNPADNFQFCISHIILPISYTGMVDFVTSFGQIFCTKRLMALDTETA